jgi:hypothetical protein
MSVDRGKKSIVTMKSNWMTLAAGAAALVAGLSPALAEAHGHRSHRGQPQEQYGDDEYEAEEAPARPHEIIIEAGDCDCDVVEEAPAQAAPEEEEEEPVVEAPAPAREPARDIPRYTVYPRHAAAPTVVVAPAARATKFGLGIMVSTVDINHGELQAPPSTAWASRVASPPTWCWAPA